MLHARGVTRRRQRLAGWRPATLHYTLFLHDDDCKTRLPPARTPWRETGRGACRPPPRNASTRASLSDSPFCPWRAVWAGCAGRYGRRVSTRLTCT